MTHRAHYESAAKKTKRRQPELYPPPIPPNLEHVWMWFLQLNRQRSNNGFALSPLSYTDIVAWCILTQTRTRPWEIDLILKIDSLYRRVVREND